MAKEVLELEVKTNVSGATSEMKDLGGAIKENISEVEELNQQLEIQNEVVNKLETSLLQMKQQQAVNSDYENSVSGLTQKIKESTVELQLEKQALKTLRAEQKAATRSVRTLEKAQKDQVKQAFAGIKHFNIMGVSLRRIRLMVRGIIPAFKLMFRTIKMGMASTGIGILVLLLTSLITSMMSTVKGASFLQAQLKVIGKVVKTLLVPFQILGDFIIDLFGVDDNSTLSALEIMENKLASIQKNLESIALREAQQGVELGKNKRIYNDITKSEEERLAAAEKNNELTKKNNADRLKELEEEKQLRADILHRAKGWVLDHERRQVADEESAKSAKNLDKRQKEYNKTIKALAKIQEKIQQDSFDFEDDIKTIKSLNIQKDQEQQKKSNAASRKWWDERKSAEKKLAGVILKLEQEAQLSSLETAQEVELKKLEFKNDKAKEDIKNSKATQKTKDEALLLLEEGYKQKQQDIADKFQEKADDKADDEADKLKDLRNENLINELDNEKERELKKLEIQKEAELESIKSFENFKELEKEINDKYDAQEDAIIKKSVKNQEKADQAKLDSQLAAFSQLSGALSSMAGDNKELAAASAIIDTYAGANKAFNQGGVAGFATGAAIILAGLNNVRKIYATDVGDGGGGGAIPAGADTQAPSGQLMQGAFTLGGGRAPDPIKAFVVTDEMTNSQDQLANIRRRATI
jgi:hypothetical protein